MTRRKMGRWITACVIGCFVACATSGCFTRTIYVPDGAPVRLREDVHRVKIWAKDEAGKWVPGRMTLKNGWYAIPAPAPPPPDGWNTGDPIQDID